MHWFHTQYDVQNDTIKVASERPDKTKVANSRFHFVLAILSVEQTEQTATAHTDFPISYFQTRTLSLTKDALILKPIVRFGEHSEPTADKIVRIAFQG